MIFRKLPTPVRAAALLAALAAALLAAGCGGGDDDASGAGGDGDGASANTYRGYDIVATTTMSTADITKTQFLNRINKICRETWPRVRENWEEFMQTRGRKLGERERFAEAVRFPLISGLDFFMFDGIVRLGAPAGEEETIEAIIVPFQAVVELGWDKRWRAYSPAEVVAQFADFNRRARRYGLDDCVVERARVERVTS